MNARLNGRRDRATAQVNVGLAVDTERGLLVPVIRDADQAGLREFGPAVPRVGRPRAGGQDPAR